MRRFLALSLLAVLALALLAAAPQPAPPLQQCANVLINTPRSGAVVRGDVEIFGSANIDRFQFYKVEFSPLNNPDAWSAVSQVIRRPVVNGRLDVWNTRAIADGLYNLKLTVVDERAQEVCRSVVTQLQVANRVPPPTPTQAEPPTPEDSPTPPASPTPGVSPTLRTTVTTPTATVVLPTIPPPPTLPLVTPQVAVAQPTAPAPTAVAKTATTPSAVPTRSGSSLLPDFSGVQRAFTSALDLSRARDAFLLGAIGTLAIFTFVGLVLLLRRLL